MNKKRLYKQNGRFHPRGDRTALEIHASVQKIFDHYPQFSARDIELLVIQQAVNIGLMESYREARVPLKGSTDDLVPVDANALSESSRAISFKKL